MEVPDYDDISVFKKYFPKKCFDKNVTRKNQYSSKTMYFLRIPYCLPINDHCKFMVTKKNVKYTMYQIYCQARLEEFGVEKFKICQHIKKHYEFKKCLVDTDQVEKYYQCEVKLENRMRQKKR